MAYICPFMSTPEKTVECTIKCALCVNGLCVIRANAMINEDTKKEIQDIEKLIRRI